ncbi:uncharacterized protein Dana_GF10602, isoform C [Drosophila ananassae]|uniref:Uncharacterized protein, isoform C n=1 Tax=Drosophila ananassae TaxID=7217 RepID=A0A0P8YI72_DROAN|nr:uncharacterized protein LOC6493471 isoform X2 [Drosophila ananassae]KPU78671.1 uncharacterized protein Dana_GF10602, isoform C [Drosophila ananassae]
MLIRSGRRGRNRSQEPSRETKKRKPEKENRSEAPKQEPRREHEEQERKHEEHKDHEHQRLAKNYEDLEEELERNLKILERAVCPLDFRPKVMATMWITKLRSPPQSSDDARARNAIAAHLAKCIKDDVFEFEPFSKPPSPDNFITIKKKLVEFE